jgi:hypothetical protein
VNLLALINRIFGAIESFWVRDRTRRAISIILAATFVVALFLIELQRRGILSSAWRFIPTNHFYAAKLAFTLLLILEVFGLVFALVRSVADAVGKQFEILSLILLRNCFEEFVYFKEPIEWAGISTPVLHIVSDAAGALLIFILLGIYYRLQRHRAITKDAQDQFRFVTAKRLLALLMLLAFLWIAVQGMIVYIQTGIQIHFFEIFFTVLVFYDILVVFISLRYTSTYHVVFRNSAFALSTVVIRLAITAPPFVNVMLGIGSALFTVGLTLAYNRFAPNGVKSDQPLAVQEVKGS